MKIKGLQKTTLLDYPGKVACTVFTFGCNFRCPFCHNASLVINESAGEISEQQFFSFLEKRKGILDGVCITGGEPLLHNDIIPFMEKIRSMGFLVKLDTNGAFPNRLREILDLGLVDYVAMDIKNSKQKYAATVGKNLFDLTAVAESVDFLKKGTVPYEFRTTVTKDFHTSDDLMDIAKWLSGCDAYYLQQFVDSGNLIDNAVTGHCDEDLKMMYKNLKKILPCTQLRGIKN